MMNLADHKELLLDALNDYRRWFVTEDTKEDKARVKEVDAAILAVQKM